MEGKRSFVCLHCGKTVSVDRQTYQEKRENPVCDDCLKRNNAENANYSNSSGELVELFDKTLSYIGNVTTRYQAKKAEKEQNRSNKQD